MTEKKNTQPEFDKKDVRQGETLNWNWKSVTIIAIAVAIVVVIFLSL